MFLSKIQFLLPQVGTLGALSLMEAIRYSEKKIKFYQASSSEMFGGKVSYVR